MIILKSNYLKELPKCCKECGFMIVDDWQEECCPELGRLYDFDEFDTKHHPDCPLIDIPDELI